MKFVPLITVAVPAKDELTPAGSSLPPEQSHAAGDADRRDRSEVGERHPDGRAYSRFHLPRAAQPEESQQVIGVRQRQPIAYGA